MEEVVWLFFADGLRRREGTFDITRLFRKSSIFAGDIFVAPAQHSLYLFSITLEARACSVAPSVSCEVVEKGHR